MHKLLVIILARLLEQHQGQHETTLAGLSSKADLGVQSSEREGGPLSLSLCISAWLQEHEPISFLETLKEFPQMTYLDFGNPVERGSILVGDFCRSQGSVCSRHRQQN